MYIDESTQTNSNYIENIETQNIKLKSKLEIKILDVEKLTKSIDLLKDKVEEHAVNSKDLTLKCERDVINLENRHTEEKNIWRNKSQQEKENWEKQIQKLKKELDESSEGYKEQIEKLKLNRKKKMGITHQKSNH
eukprot:UN33386